VLCTTSRARKVVVALTLVALITAAISEAHERLFETVIAYPINMIMFNGVVPVTVLIINVIVVREVRRRASSDAASNLGIQHHQSTSSNSAVPTVMLVTTSLIYILLNGVISFTYMAAFALQIDGFFKFYPIAYVLYTFVFVYNFYVYLVTGKQFRSELHKLFCACCRRCSSSPPPPPAAAAAAAAAVVNVRMVRRGQADTAV